MYKVDYSPYNLQEEFPVHLLERHEQGDEIKRLHFHNCLEIGYCCEGEGIFIVDNKILTFSKGDVSVIFKNQIHIAQSEKGKLSRWKFLSLMIWFKDLQSKHTKYLIYKV